MTYHVETLPNPPATGPCHRIAASNSLGCMYQVGIAAMRMHKGMFAMKSVVQVLVASFVLAAPAAQAQVALNENTHITDSLVAVVVGDTIRNECSSISAKMFVVLSEYNALKSYAIEQGYTEAEVKVFLKNKTEKTRIKSLAAAYLKAAGAVEGDEESYCKAGRDEIAKGSFVGSLLRSWK
ncbi:MAG: DUF5333 domain-containing protein [Microgenomates group bacterium]